MSLHDMDDPAAAIAECARVLEPAGLLCAAIVHPLNRPEERLASYFEHQHAVDPVEVDGLTMTFEAIDRPMEYYTRALEQAGFVIEALREPRPDAAPPRSGPSRDSPRPRAGRSSCTCAAAARPRRVRPNSISGPEPGLGKPGRVLRNAA